MIHWPFPYVMHYVIISGEMKPSDAASEVKEGCFAKQFGIHQYSPAKAVFVSGSGHAYIIDQPLPPDIDIEHMEPLGHIGRGESESDISGLVDCLNGDFLAFGMVPQEFEAKLVKSLKQKGFEPLRNNPEFASFPRHTSTRDEIGP